MTNEEPPVRRRSARIAGFPAISHDGQPSEQKERIVPSFEPLFSSGGEQFELSRHRSTRANSEVPTYTIDLSLPPAERYVKVATDFKSELLELTGLFDEVVGQLGISLGLIRMIARGLLWRLHSREQTEELRGISDATGVDMYLLISLNTLLDLFMGCTSGGISVKAGSKKKMMHFRTLDWGMDGLRKVLVQMEYVLKPGGEVIARSINYVGFIGILTAVRKDLSVSLNFRPYHDNDDSKLSNLKFYGHHLLVLLGLRPSISSILRDFFIPKTPCGHEALFPSSKHKKPALHTWHLRPEKSPLLLPTLYDIIETLPSIRTTAAYLIFSGGNQTVVFEKDRVTAQVNSSQSFIVATNHDVRYEETNPEHRLHAKHGTVTGMQDIVEESMDRKGCMVAKWQREVRRAQTRFSRSTSTSTSTSKRTLSEDDVAIDEAKLIRWIQDYPITNESTHFATVMDPDSGRIVWMKIHKQPVESSNLFIL